MIVIGGFMILAMVPKDYISNSQTAFSIPDINKGFIPQGIDYDPESDNFFVTGYMDLGKNSPIYAIDKTSGALKKKIQMTTADGKPFRGHAGGLSVFGGRLYIAGSTDSCMYSFSAADILNAEDNTEVPISGVTGLKTSGESIRVSFTSRDESFLYAGEFHKEPIFYTDDSHSIGEEDVNHKAYLLGFSVNENADAVLSHVYSIPDSVQGAFIDDGYLYLSQSSGFLPGRILTYDLSRIEPSGTRNVLGQEIPLYFISEKKADKVTAVPPMPEEITVADGYMYILHEAASNRYLIGKLLGLDKVRRTPIGYFK